MSTFKSSQFAILIQAFRALIRIHLSAKLDPRARTLLSKIPEFLVFASGPSKLPDFCFSGSYFLCGYQDEMKHFFRNFQTSQIVILNCFETNSLNHDVACRAIVVCGWASAEYMEKFTSEQIESWNENWRAHGHHSEERKVQFYQIMHAYAEVLRHARGSAIAQDRDGHRGCGRQRVGHATAAFDASS